MTRPWRLRLVAALSLAISSILAVSVQGELSMLLIVHRHGTRTRLAKDGTKLDEDFSILADEGMKDMYKLGSEVRSRYISPSCATTATCLAGNWTSYDHDSWYSVSTAEDWTLQAAQAFYLGVLGPIGSADPNATSLALLAEPRGIQPVPVHSYDNDLDWVLRSYGGGGKKCPAIVAGFDALYKSPEWEAKVKETAPLMDSLTKILTPKEAYTLKKAWSIFDDCVSQRLYGAGTSAGGPKDPKLDTACQDNTTYAALKDAAHWLEWHKHANRSFAGPFCGGGLLTDIVERIKKGPTEGPAFVEYSGHYRSLLCFFSALDLHKQNPGPDVNAWLKIVPTYAAHVAVEVKGTGDTTRVTLQYQDGPGTEKKPIMLPCSDVDGSCSLAEFEEYTAPSRYASVGDWCKACGEGSKMKDCLVGQVDTLKAQIAAVGAGGSMSSTTEKGSSSKKVPGWSVAIGTLLGTLFGLAIGVAVGKFVFGSRRPYSDKLSEPSM